MIVNNDFPSIYFQEGVNAYLSGVPLKNCPYTRIRTTDPQVDVTLFGDWTNGWKFAQNFRYLLFVLEKNN